MQGTKQSYAELLRTCGQQEKEIARLKRAIAEADRSIHLFHVSDWIAVPLPDAQRRAVLGAIENSRGLPPCEGRCVGRDGDESQWEQQWEDEYDTLPGKRHYLVRYAYTTEEGITNVRVWALEPF